MAIRCEDKYYLQWYYSGGKIILNGGNWKIGTSETKIFQIPPNFPRILFSILFWLQARIATDLIELRNKSVFAFFMMNALFVLIVFLLQLNKDNIHVEWPFGVKTNITYIEETAEVSILFHKRVVFCSKHGIATTYMLGLTCGRNSS